MHNALRRAKLNPSDVGYINAHATSNPVGNPVERSCQEHQDEPGPQPAISEGDRAGTGQGGGGGADRAGADGAAEQGPGTGCAGDHEAHEYPVGMSLHSAQISRVVKKSIRTFTNIRSISGAA